MVRKPKNLPEGEYRTHMVFQTLPEQKANILDELASDEVGVSVQPIIEISIPVIIRHGSLQAGIRLEDANLMDDKMKFTLKREGNRSVYGDVEIFINSGPQKDTRVGFVRGLAVYYPNSLRYMAIPLNTPEGVTLGNEEMLIRYTEDKT